MTYSFTWNTQPKVDNEKQKITKADATQYIKARYGISPTEFAKMIIKEQTKN